MTEEVKNIMVELLTKLTADFTKVAVEEQDDCLYVNIESSDPRLLIGYKGNNLKSLEYILKLLIRNKEKKFVNIFLDVDNYRQNQIDNAINIANKNIEIIRTSLTEKVLPSMDPFTRRKVHIHLMQDEYSDIETESRGEEPFRSIVLIPKMP